MKSFNLSNKHFRNLSFKIIQMNIVTVYNVLKICPFLEHVIKLWQLICNELNSLSFVCLCTH